MRVDVMSMTVMPRLQASAAKGRRICGNERPFRFPPAAVQDSDRNIARDGRKNRAGMQHLGPEVSQLRSFRERQLPHDLSLVDDARVRGEHAVDVGPDLDFVCRDGGPDQGRRIIGSPAAQRGRLAVRGAADETTEHGNTSGRENRVE